jgi:hypothetical protein
VGQKLVSVVWHKNRFSDGEWILVVAPGDMPMPWDKFRGRNAVLRKEELMLVSRDIHALLDSATGISNVMWYFDEFRRQGGTAVRTPDELPWAETWLLYTRRSRLAASGRDPSMGVGHVRIGRGQKRRDDELRVLA